MPEEVEARVADFIEEIIAAMPYKGETTAKAIVKWIVASNVTVWFNVRPILLKSPTTKQALEYDIFLPKESWAGEYWGDQHYGPTNLYPDEHQYIMRHQRNREKAQLSEKNNIKLSVISKHDLTLAKINTMIPPEIRRRDYDPKGPVAKLLGQVGKSIATAKDHWDRG